MIKIFENWFKIESLKLKFEIENFEMSLKFEDFELVFWKLDS